MDACSSNTKNWGRVAAWRKCLNGSTIPVQAPTKLSASSLCPCFVFSPKRPAQRWRKLIELKIDRPVAQLRHSSHAVCKIPAVSEEHYRQGYGSGVCEPLLWTLWHLKCIRLIAAMYISSRTILRNCETELQSPHKNLAWWAVTPRTSQNCRTVKIGGWPLSQKWVLAWNNMVSCA